MRQNIWLGLPSFFVMITFCLVMLHEDMCCINEGRMSRATRYSQRMKHVANFCAVDSMEQLFLFLLPLKEFSSHSMWPNVIKGKERVEHRQSTPHPDDTKVNPLSVPTKERRMSRTSLYYCTILSSPPLFVTREDEDDDDSPPPDVGSAEYNRMRLFSFVDCVTHTLLCSVVSCVAWVMR